MSTDFRGQAAAEGSAAGLTPGEHLRAEIERLGLDQVAVSAATGVSRQSINYIVNGRQAISRAMAAKLGRLTGHGPDYWLRASFPRDGGTAMPAGLSEPNAPLAGGGPLVNHEIVRAIKERIISVEPFDESQVQPASLDLACDDFIDTAAGERIDVTAGHGFVLLPGQSVIVTSKEWLEFPTHYVGRVGAMASLARRGIVTAHGLQIDPGFKGNLQFCLFNAGGTRFVLRAGMPLISIEIMPLSASPTPDERASRHLSVAGNRETVTPLFRQEACERLIRDALRARAVIDMRSGQVEARIAELNVVLEAASADAALDAVVRSALAGLALLRAQPGAARDERERYAAFFDDVAGRLQLNGEEARQVLTCLGFTVERGAEALLLPLADGQTALVQLPPRQAAITLTQLARQLREDPADLVLMLAGVRRYGEAG